MNQIGALIGPLTVAGVLALTGGDYTPAVAILAVAGAAALPMLLWLRARVPNPLTYETGATAGPSTPTRAPAASLFDQPPDPHGAEVGEQPACFADLRLDQVMAAVLAGREEYDLTSWLYTPTRDPATVTYRHKVFQDLDHDDVHRAVDDFASRCASSGG